MLRLTKVPLPGVMDDYERCLDKAGCLPEFQMTTNELLDVTLTPECYTCQVALCQAIVKQLGNA